MSYKGNQCQGCTLLFCLSFFPSLFTYLFIYSSELLYLGCFFRQASFLVTNKKITCQNVSSRGRGGGRGGGELNRVPMLELVLCLNNILLAECFLSYVLDKKKNTIFQQSFQFPTLNDNLTLRTVRKEVDLFFFFFCSRITTKMGSKMDIPVPQIRSKQRHRNKHDGRKNP